MPYFGSLQSNHSLTPAEFISLLHFRVIKSISMHSGTMLSLVINTPLTSPYKYIKNELCLHHATD